MSAELYTVRVYFDGSRPGCIRIDGMQRIITQAPTIPGLPELAAIDFAPATATYQLRTEHQGMREMLENEIAAVHRWLARVAEGTA